MRNRPFVLWASLIAVLIVFLSIPVLAGMRVPHAPQADLAEFHPQLAGTHDSFTISMPETVDALVAFQSQGSTLAHATLYVLEDVTAYARNFADSLTALGAQIVEVHGEETAFVDAAGRCLLAGSALVCACTALALALRRRKHS